MNKALVLIVLPLLVSGCSRFALGNNSLDYQKAAQLPPLTVPAGVELRPRPRCTRCRRSSPPLRRPRK